MNGRLLRHGLRWAGWGLVTIVGIGLMLAAALNAGYLSGPFVKFLAARTEREIRVDGPLRLNIFSLHPRLIAERVTIGSPPWAPAGTAAEIGKVTVVLTASWRAGALSLESLEMDAATLHFFCDSTGHANWQLENPDQYPPQGLPVINSLSVPSAHVLLNDELRHRQFDGTVSAQDVKGPGAVGALRIEGKGQLNGRPLNFEVSGDPLRTASQDKPYGFTFSERSSGSHLSGKGTLWEPFNLGNLDATFEANGADLKDFYYLTGAKFIDTGSYRLSGKLMRRGSTSTYSNLTFISGQSDLRGTVSVKASKGRVGLDADVSSQMLRLADLGARAAGRDPEVGLAEPMLLSTRTLNPDALRRSDATIKYRARRMEANRVVLTSVAAKATIDRGVLSVTQWLAEISGGKLNAQVKIDARKENPAILLELKIAGLQLGQYARRKGGPPAIDGPLALQASLTGQGKSLHEFAASADGTMLATLRSGTVRDSLAELTGIDLKGLGLLLTKSQKEVPVRCGIANFEAHDGTLTAKELVLDTEPVLIAGEGFIHMDTETLDIALRGYPKATRFLQLRAPILIGGTLAKPSVGIQARDSKLVLVDRGHAKDVDCESMRR
jgi:uncharacterized protein involved in outer membrane biogenesis